MTSVRLHTAGSVVFMMLGVLHLLGHAAGPAEEDLDVFVQMRAFTIEFMGTHDLLTFYNGFSVTMGALCIAFGGLAYLVGRRHPDPVVSRFAAMCTAGVGVLAVIYFHPLAWGMAFASTLLLAAASTRRLSA